MGSVETELKWTEEVDHPCSRWVRIVTSGRNIEGETIPCGPAFLLTAIALRAEVVRSVAREATAEAVNVLQGRHDPRKTREVFGQTYELMKNRADFKDLIRAHTKESPLTHWVIEAIARTIWDKQVHQMIQQNQINGILQGSGKDVEKIYREQHEDELALFGRYAGDGNRILLRKYSVEDGMEYRIRIEPGGKMILGDNPIIEKWNDDIIPKDCRQSLEGDALEGVFLPLSPYIILEGRKGGRDNCITTDWIQSASAGLAGRSGKSSGFIAKSQRPEYKILQNEIGRYLPPVRKDEIEKRLPTKLFDGISEDKLNAAITVALTNSNVESRNPK